ncbi:DUF998 domain-containing protein [Cellulomonas sp. S1-8]|uniref:DUF998 domain-containing protein n=1 Tax=Cellulomonas sp. S1-8 TaxID=2904790 RepID=UPI0022437B1D|nr:DUF998 domain-containing protein [Cellulomonas sp. S1-8]UZN03960.1 DUF998 domain-containing protein [Cellulomonas sp. S1-8]
MSATDPGARAPRPGPRSRPVDVGAAVTRSLLGWGVVAGPFYLAVGLTLALTREGFDLARHPLSALMLGPGGWMQRTTLVLTGLMVVAAGIGFRRVARAGVPARGGTAVVVAGCAAVVGGIAVPDAVAGFPPGSAGGSVSVSGLVHLAAGGVQLVALSVAALALGAAVRRAGRRAGGRWSRVAAVVVLVGFVGGAALSSGPVGILLLWCAVVVAYAWLAVSSVRLYRESPHPEGTR